MNKTQLFLKRHSSTILTVIGGAGVAATAVLSVKATPKALKLLEKAQEEKGENLTLVETVKVAWKPYIPAVTVGVSTVACIFGANYLNIKNQASLMSAYALLDSSFKEYRNKVDDIYGEKSDINVKQEVVNSKYDENMVLHDGKLLFFDYQSMQFFESTMEHMLYAENAFLEIFHAKGYACLNEYYDIVGIPRVDYGYQLGWFDLLEDNDPYNCHELEFDYEEITVGNGQKCWIVKMSMPPSFDYIL